MSNQDQQEKQSEWRNRELGALWVRNGKNQKYLSGSLKVETMPGVTETVKVVVFTNKNREKNERAPDYVVYRSEDREQSTSSTVEKAVDEAIEETSQVTTSQTSEEVPEELF